MRDQVADLAERGKKLAPAERSRLVDLLLESLHEAPLADVEALGMRRSSIESLHTIGAKCNPSMAKRF